MGKETIKNEIKQMINSPRGKLFSKESPLEFGRYNHELSKLLLQDQGEFDQTFFCFFNGRWHPFIITWENEEEQKIALNNLATMFIEKNCDSFICTADAYWESDGEFETLGKRPKNLKKHECLTSYIVSKNNSIHVICTVYEKKDDIFSFDEDYELDYTFADLPNFKIIFDKWNKQAANQIRSNEAIPNDDHYGGDIEHTNEVLYKKYLLRLEKGINDESIAGMVKLAEAGFINAQRYVGLCYFNGNGVERDWEKARTWFEKAYEQGDIIAGHNLGKIYFSGLGVDIDIKKGISLLEKSTAVRDPLIEYKVAETDENLDARVGWLLLSAEDDNVFAEYEFQSSRFYRYSRNLEDDLTSVNPWYVLEKAKNGNALYQKKLAEMYYKIYGKFYARALFWLEKAKSNIDSLSQDDANDLMFCLADCTLCYDASLLDERPDKFEAFTINFDWGPQLLICNSYERIKSAFTILDDLCAKGYSPAISLSKSFFHH